MPSARCFPPPWMIEEHNNACFIVKDATGQARLLRMTMMMTDNGPMTAEQAATSKRLAQEAYELDAFKPNLTRAEADKRIAMLTAKLKLLDGSPHTL